MSNTPPIERLNYFNGQRLEAADFRLEQDYHTRVRRLLTQALLTPGIAAGLEVEKMLPEPSHAVTVRRGVALDSMGREIILVEERQVPVAGRATAATDLVTGNYLVIEYVEEATAFLGDGCAVRLGVTCRATEDLEWGAPSRIRAEPEISIQHEWPKMGDNKIVLAQLALNLDCSVREIRTFVRKYVGAAQLPKVRALALEGEKDIDKNNPKNLYFHIEGGHIEKAVLYLRAAKFSSLYYTELGQHHHEIDLTSTENGAVPKHAHKLVGKLETEVDGGHRHGIIANVALEENANAFLIAAAADQALPFPLTADGTSTSPLEMQVLETLHRHTIKASDDMKTDEDPGLIAHAHDIIGPTKKAGVSVAAREGKSLEFVRDLKIDFDDKPITSAVLSVLQWKELGDGSEDHPLVVPGTGEIDLRQVGVDLKPGEHCFTFSLDPKNDSGGQIQYNLYIQ